MKILILCGTQFVGRHMTQAALDAGHSVTLFNRGKTNADLFPQVEKLVGDRDRGLNALKGRGWDTVIDVNGYVPRLVRDSAELLKGAVERYAFLSTVSVYADFSQPIDEESPLATLEDESVEEITGETYGGLKALCEKVVEEVFPERGLIIRPGYVVGPHDHTDQFTYWVRRAAQGGEMVAPGSPEENVRIIDGRDLAEWTLRMVAQGATGVYNAVGPDYHLTFGEILETAKRVSGSDAAFSWISQDFAEEHDLMDTALPLWNAGANYIGIRRTDNEKALAAGLTFRPLETTIADTLAWRETATGVEFRQVGLTAEKEREVLEKWRERE